MEKLKFLFLCAHPDDLEFYIGYILYALGENNSVGLGKNRIFSSKSAVHPQNRPYSVCVACMTRGEMSELTLSTRSSLEAARIRSQELINAFKALGHTDVRFLGFFDGFIRISEEAVNRVKDFILDYQPDFIMAPEPNFTWYFHNDHRRTGKIAYWAIQRIIKDLNSNNPNSVISKGRKIPALYYYTSLFHHFYFPKYDEFTEGVRKSLLAHESQSDLLFGAGVVMDKISTYFHGLHLPKFRYAQALRRQFIPGKDSPRLKVILNKNNTLWKRILYAIAFKIFRTRTIPEYQTKLEFVDGTLPPNIKK